MILILCVCVSACVVLYSKCWSPHSLAVAIQIKVMKQHTLLAIASQCAFKMMVNLS